MSTSPASPCHWLTPDDLSFITWVQAKKASAAYSARQSTSSDIRMSMEEVGTGVEGRRRWELLAYVDRDKLMVSRLLGVSSTSYKTCRSRSCRRRVS